MMEAMGAAISGLEAEQTMLNTTASNLANVDTIGYKSQETSFVDALSQTIAGGTSATDSNGGSDPEQVGLGVQVGSIENDMSQGSDQSTGVTTDVAIQSENGFFQVASPTAADSTPTNPDLTGANIQYTRAGNFQVSPNGYLTNQSGQYVVGVAANPTTGQPDSATTIGTTALQIPAGGSNVAIGTNGEVTYTNSSGTQSVAGYIQLANFNNDAGLSRDGGSMWSATTASGTPTYNIPGAGGMGLVQSGELESSNVDMATEFANMIDAQNGYEADSKVITTADQMLQALVSMPQ